MATEALEENREESPEYKLWTHCGRLRAGELSGGRAEFSRAGGHGRRRARRRGPASGRAPGGESNAQIWEEFLKNTSAGQALEKVQASPG